VQDCRRVNSFPILPAWRSCYAPEITHNREHVFIASCGGRPPITLNPGEHIACRWLLRKVAAELAFSHTNRDAILDFVPAL
jgi:dATP pyrophosphohydrolase